jgi:flagellar P-ring protein precursor FlgI
MLRAMAALMMAFGLALSCQAQTRIKDITDVRSVRSNQLYGYGLVIGLNGTGDSLRNAPFTQQSMQSMLDRMGINIRGAEARTKNIAAVMVMAELMPFASAGSRIDVTVASLGDATSLVGGTLLLTPLYAGDNQIYAVAQGSVAVGGLSASGKAETVTRGVPTSGRIANGALVERTVPVMLESLDRLDLELRNPDFATVIGIVDTINEYSLKRFGVRVASEGNMRSVALWKPPSIGPARFLAEIGALQVTADVPAKVVIDERTGTIVIGKDVQVSTVAVAHGNVVVRVTETPRASQPQPFSEGRTVVLPETTVDVNERGGALHMIGGTRLNTLVSGLNRIGLKPSGIIAILQALKSAGALQAELIVQ